MAVTRQDRKFVDISLSFLRNPVSNDILLIRDENAIKTSVRNLIFTYMGERFFNPLLGSTIRDSLFELADDVTSIKIERSIRQVLENYEPRIKVLLVNPEYDADSNECRVEIIYEILGSEVVPQNLTVVLQATKS